jgi:hypothetical protein
MSPKDQIRSGHGVPTDMPRERYQDSGSEEAAEIGD